MKAVVAVHFTVCVKLAVQAKSMGMTTVLIQSKTMLEETGYTLET